MVKEQNKVETKPVEPVKKGKVFGDPEAHIEW
jgi:hypothetical protein